MYILGSGPSVTQGQLDFLVDANRNGATVVACSQAVYHFPWPVTTKDKPLNQVGVIWDVASIPNDAKLPPMVFVPKGFNKRKGVVEIKTNPKYTLSRNLENGVSSFGSSVGFAIALAHTWTEEDIYLVGVDFVLDEQGNYGYWFNKNWSSGEPPVMEYHRNMIESIAKDPLANTIYNASPTSTLVSYPKKELV